MTTAPIINADLRRRTAETMLGPIEWSADFLEGWCTCPGAAMHTSPSRRRHTVVYVAGAPTVRCVHTSCRPAVDDFNRKLRGEIGRAERGQDPSWRPDPAEVERQRAERVLRAEAEAKEARLVETAGKALEKILTRWQWCEADAWEESPIRLDGPPEADHRLLLHYLYDPGAVLWCGERHESGQSQHKANFRTAAEWSAISSAPAPLICPSLFSTDTFSRSAEAVEESPFLVLEADAIDPTYAAKAERSAAIRADEAAGEIEPDRARRLLAKYAPTEHDLERNRAGCLALTRWLREEVRLRLRAVVDSGNRSMHAWFDRPPEPITAELVALAPGLKLDPATFRPAQPVRLPGWRRETGRWQRLIYLERRNHP